MNVDLHTHTYPASTCSHISYRDYIAWCVDQNVEAVALTNHGDVSDNRKLEGALAAEGVLLIHGVEVSTMLGDLVVLSPDLDYLAGFDDVQEAPRAGTVADHAAVVWVHPAAGGGRSGSSYYPGLERLAGPIIDAVEVYNGSWLEERYVRAAERIADQLGLARTGGSDAHEPDQLMACYTEFPDPIRSTADVVDCLKRRVTVPHRGAAKSRRRRFGLF
jgi:predicted metal-dependent phosphoesterase TrpH